MKRKKEEANIIPVTVKKGSTEVLSRLAFLDKDQLHAVLATVYDNGPYTSLVAYALTPDLNGLIFATPRGTQKYRNMIRNKYVSLLIDTRSNTSGDYKETEAITIIGNAKALKKGRKRDEFMKVLLKKHPKLKKFVEAPSTSLMLVKIIKCIHVNSFQIVSEINMGDLQPKHDFSA
jgi:heme iron utilization protein